VCFQILVQDTQQFASSIKQLDDATQSVVGDIYSGRQQLIQKIITSLLSRLEIVKDETTKREKALSKQWKDLATYQVRHFRLVLYFILLQFYTFY